MGRTLLLASLRPFKQVVGVEVSRALCAVARDNVSVWRERRDLACNDVRVVCADAAAWRYPHRDVLLYLYNPFGAATLSRLIDRVVLEVEGALTVVYHTPVQRGVLDRRVDFSLAADLGYGVVYKRES